MIEFPTWVTTTPCETRTFSTVHKTPHGTVRLLNTMSPNFSIEIVWDRFGVYSRIANDVRTQ